MELLKSMINKSRLFLINNRTNGIKIIVYRSPSLRYITHSIKSDTKSSRILLNSVKSESYSIKSGQIQVILYQIWSNPSHILSNLVKSKSYSIKSRQILSNPVKSCPILSNLNPIPVKLVESCQILSNPVKSKSNSSQILSYPNPIPVKSCQIQIQFQSNLVKPKSNSSQILSNPILELDLDLIGFGFGASLVETINDNLYNQKVSFNFLSHCSLG